MTMTPPSMNRLTGTSGPDSDVPEWASRFASIALGHVAREYPNKLDHILRGPDDLQPPSVLHPAFYGSFDWHSCVHGTWLLARLLRLFPKLPEAAAIRRHLATHLTPTTIAAECAYLQAPFGRSFERPYGWAWLLALAAELGRAEDEVARNAGAALAPLAAVIGARWLDHLPRAGFPIRAGTHGNTAFALTLAIESGPAELAHACRQRALEWFGGDVDCPAWEPDGEDFLSPALMEAVCMMQVLPPAKFAPWLDKFLPRLAQGEPATLFRPAAVLDRTDGRLAHLDGLNLSRAWCWRRLAAGFSPDDPRLALAEAAAGAHLSASWAHLTDDYMGEHWLATFTLLALEPALCSGSGNPPGG